MTEADLHRAVADYLAHAITSPWTTFPAGGGGRARGAQLKGMGLTAGWPDIQIVHGGRFYGIELKAKGKYPEPHQRAIHDAIRTAGGRVAVCRSLAEVEDALTTWRVPIRARIAA